MPYIKLIKLLYLADRRSLVESGYTITGDNMVSMDHGPVLSRVYDSNKPGRADGYWQRHIGAPHDYEVDLLEPSDGMALSDYEHEVLAEVFEKFGHLDTWALVEYMHALPEWEDPSGSSRPIDARVILREAGKSDVEIEHIAEQVASFRSFVRVASDGRS
jgi:uncharacterized phage-associated protein